MPAAGDSQLGAQEFAEATFRKTAEAAIQRDDARELADLVLEIAQDATSWEWAQSCCIQLSRHLPAVRPSDRLAVRHTHVACCQRREEYN